VGSTKVSDEKLSRVLASVRPVTLPMQAYGPQPVEWFDPKLPVWAWVQWPDRAAERVEAWACGANNLVVVLEVPCDGGHWQPVVWRNAVTVSVLAGSDKAP
jgi:hypothetical protein